LVLKAPAQLGASFFLTRCFSGFRYNGYLCYDPVMDSLATERRLKYLQRLHDSGSPLIMGTINLTDDSFYASSRSADTETVLKKVRQMEAEGADLIDLGAESTRPGSLPVDELDEACRIKQAVKSIREISQITLSIDTRHASVAACALEEGADVINDISGFRDDPQLSKLVASKSCPVIIMHMQGNPHSMQNAPYYSDVFSEVRDFLLERVQVLISMGVPRQGIVIDPGLGFGKSVEHNTVLLSRLQEFADTGYPVLLGHSRKTWIGKIVACSDLVPPPEQRLFGTVALSAIAAQAGVRILRVHDVGPNRDAASIGHALRKQSQVVGGLR